MAVLGGAEVKSWRFTTTIEFDQRAVNEAAETRPEEYAHGVALLGSLYDFAE